MFRLPSGMDEAAGALGRMAALAAETVKDRVELLALELREDKTRFVQLLVLACFGVVFALLGLILGVLAVLLLLPPEWRAAGLALMAGACLLGALWAFFALRKRLCYRPLAFAQSLAELEKDKACF